jgi:hypothetical protein
MSWVDVENAMQAAVVAASRLNADKVTWSYQNVNEPALDHVVINFGGAIGIGQDWIKNDQDLSRPQGQEIQQRVRGVREVPFEIECFTTTTSGGAAARQLAEVIRSRFRLSTVRSPLIAVGLSPFDTSGAVNWIPDIPTVNFRGRATCTIRCYVPVEDCDEYVGYISRVTGRLYVSGISITGYGTSAYTGYGQSGFAFDSNNG